MQFSIYSLRLTQRINIGRTLVRPSVFSDDNQDKIDILNNRIEFCWYCFDRVFFLSHVILFVRERSKQIACWLVCPYFRQVFRRIPCIKRRYFRAKKRTKSHFVCPFQHLLCQPKNPMTNWRILCISREVCPCRRARSIWVLQAVYNLSDLAEIPVSADTLWFWFRFLSQAHTSIFLDGLFGK